MDLRRRMSWTTVALAVVLAIGMPMAAAAQGPRGVPEPYTPAPNAKDLKAVLFNWMWGMGMLKGHDERDMVASLEYQGKGTIQVDGQPCTLTKYRASTNYQTFSQRIQYACTRANGQTYSNIEVVSGLYAWNEDTPGAEIGPAKGKTTPMPATVQERLIRIWASPQGAPKAAVAGTTDTFWLGANPGTLFADGAAKVGQTSVAWEGNKPVVTFPIPGVPGATATATLDAKYMTERVVVTQGTTTTEFTYADHRDWNNPLNKITVYYAGKITERRNGAVDYLNKSMLERGLYYYARTGDGVPYHIYLNKKIDKADLTGLKIRIAPIYREFFTKLGATVVQIPPGEVYTALDRGVVDGYGWPLLGIFDLGWHEKTKYRVEPGFYNIELGVVFGAKAWNALTPAQRAFFDKQVAWLEGLNADMASKDAPADIKRQQEAGIQVIKLSDDEAKRFQQLSLDAGWAGIVATAPTHAAKLRELMAPVK